MKLVITAKGQTLDSEVDPRFGRAANFIVFDTESGEWRAEDNSQNLKAMSGAGIQAAENVARLGAEGVLTGHCGPKAFRTLSSGGIQIFTTAQGTVQECIDKFNNGELSIASTADVEGHWM